MAWLQAFAFGLAVPQGLGLWVNRSGGAGARGALAFLKVTAALLVPPAAYLAIDEWRWTRFWEGYVQMTGHAPCSLLRWEASVTALMGTVSNLLAALLLQVWLRWRRSAH